MNTIKFRRFKMRISQIITLCFFFTVSSVYADVFLLAPISSSNPSEALHPLQIWNETVYINGVKSTLKTSLLRYTKDQAYKILLALYPDAKFAKNDESILMELKDGNIRKRLYLVECGHPPYPLIQFSIEYGEIPKNVKWPSSLPSAPDMIPVQTMEFPERKSIFGKFSSSFRRRDVLSALNSALLADNWQPLTRESVKAHIGEAKGEIYMRNNPPEIITISVYESENGRTEAGIYRKRLKMD